MQENLKRPQSFVSALRRAKSNPFALSILTTSIIASLASPAFAADEALSASDEMDQMTVLGKTYRNTATKTALLPEETPQGISVVTSEDLEQRGVSNVGQALRYVPGVNAELKGGSVTMYDNYNIRGFDNDQMYYDGLVLQYLVGWNLQPQIDPFALEQVEIFKGPSSVLYGAMPPGGMVNLIGKAPQKEHSTQVGVATGTGNLAEATFDSTGQIGDSDVNYRVIAKARKKDGQIDHTEEEPYLIAPSIDWQMTDKTSLNLNLYYQNDPNMGMNSAIPASGSVWSNSNGSMDKSMFVGDENWSKFEREFLMVGYKINHEFNQDWSFLQNARYLNADLHQDNTYHVASGYDASTGDLERYIYSTDEESEGFVIDNQVSGFVMTGELEHNLLFGFDYQKLNGKSDYTDYGSDAQFGTFNVFSPNNDIINASALSGTVYTDKVDIEQTGYYFQDQMQYGALTMMAGGRFDHYEYESNYVGSVTKESQREFSYRVGALYAFDNGISPYANYATSFQPTAKLDENGDTYKPELGKQFEVGVKYQSADMAQTVTAAYFNIEKQDVLMSDPDNPWYYLQVGEVRSQGLELEGKFMLTDSWDVAASYAYTDIEITKDSNNGLEGKRPIYVPKHSATLWSNYYLYDGALAGTRFGAGVRFVGEREMDAENTDTVPDYTLVDLSASYDLTELSSSLSGASLSVSANNVFDEDNFTCYDSANCWYGQERTVEVGFDYKF